MKLLMMVQFLQEMIIVRIINHYQAHCRHSKLLGILVVEMDSPPLQVDFVGLS